MSVPHCSAKEGTALMQARHPLRVQPSDHTATVFVIDDDASMRRAIKNLLGSVDLHVEVFASVGWPRG
jgi:hypothetical protein